MIRSIVWLMSSLLITQSLMSQTENLKVLHEKTASHLREVVSKTRGAMGFSALDLTNGERFGENENLVFPQASAIKIAILMEVFKQAHEGKFKLSDVRRIRKEDKTGGSGVLIELGDGTVELSLRDLCVLMMVLSDNTATNLLIDLVGQENINASLISLGLKQTKVQRRMMDTAASHRGDENISTPTEAARIMEILFKGEFISHTVCDDILSILKKLKTSNLKAALPEDVETASKPGSISGVTTEWAIVYLKERPYVLVVMENYGMGDAPDAMKEISKTLYEYFSRLAKATPHGALVDKAAR
jgi:beta-lactamase class A